MAAHTDNSIVIEAPVQLVWKMMNDVENWPNLYTEYAETEILNREGDTIRFRITMHPDADNQVWSWISERTADPTTYRTSSHRIETGPFEYMNIEWFFEPVNGATRMRWVQDFAMKPAAPANDEQMEEYINQNTEIQMSVIKERIELAATSERG
jgi:aromatase